MQGERKIKLEDISFESDTHNIFDPYYSSESEDDFSGSSGDESCYDSESEKSYGTDDDDDDMSSFSSQGHPQQPSMFEEQKFLHGRNMSNYLDHFSTQQ